jgi:hypothetical protein
VEGACSNWCTGMSEITYLKEVAVVVYGRQAIVNDGIFF